MTPGNELIFLALGGSGEIGMNVNLYGTQGKWVMVDLGLTFGGTDYPGIDLVHPADGIPAMYTHLDGTPYTDIKLRG